MISFSEVEARVKIIKAMPRPVRLMVFEFPKGGELSFSEILNLFQFDKPTIHMLIDMPTTSQPLRLWD